MNRQLAMISLDDVGGVNHFTDGGHVLKVGREFVPVRCHELLLIKKESGAFYERLKQEIQIGEGIR